MGVAPGGRWAPLSKEREDLPAGIDALIDKGLSSRPRSSYQNAQEYLKAISEIGIAHQPVPKPKPPARPVIPVVPTPQHSRISKRMILIVIAVLLGLVLIGVYLATDNSGPTVIVDPPPVTESYVNLQGTWYDELAGAGISLLHVAIQQNGNSVSGPILDNNGIQWGTISGSVNGNILDYNSYSNYGNSWGRATLDPDGNHMQVLEKGVIRHILHRNHLPPY